MRANFQKTPRKLFCVVCVSRVFLFWWEARRSTSKVGGDACVCAPVFTLVHWSWERGVGVGGCADQEDQDEEEGVEVEEGGLWGLLVSSVRLVGIIARTIVLGLGYGRLC